jgi:tetratricopeptide (TPR) repeat protein
VILAAVVELALPPPAAPASSPHEDALRGRAAQLLERREQARREGGVSLDPLQRDLVAVADELEQAGIDSLAAAARYRAGGVLARLNREGDARAQLARAIEGARRARASRLELSVRSYLADLLVNEDPIAALETVRALLPRFRALRSEKQLGAARTTEARAWTALGRAREALAASRRAAAHYRKAGDFTEESWALAQASQALRFLGRHAEALTLADSVLALGEREEIGRSLARGWLEKASCLRAMGREEEGLVAADRALDVDRRLGDVRHQMSVRRFRLSLLLELDRFAECAREADSLLAMSTDSEDPTLELTAATFRSAASLGLGVSAGVESALVPHLERYERFRRSLPSDEDQASTAQHGGSAYTVLASALRSEGRLDDAWRAAERGRAFALKSRLGAPDEPDLAGLLDHLAGARAALIQFEGASPRFGTVFVLAGGRVAARSLTAELSGDDLALAVERLGERRGEAVDDPALGRLAHALLGDVWPAIPPGVERLVIVPPPAATALPFEALPGPPGSGLARVADRWAVSYVPGAALLPLLAARDAPTGRVVAVVDPAVHSRGVLLASLDEDVRRGIARSLPAARKEGRRLARDGARVLAGRDATLAGLVELAPSAVLHFATHALEHPRLAPRGGLVLAGDPPLLTAAAVESLGVAADLVSLSACRTLGSVSYGGEGAFGLARAFLAAGARTVVTTRWEVGDRAAARMMELFYDGLRQGLARDQALARAGRRMADEGHGARDRWAFLLLGAGSAPLPLGDGR